MTLQQRVLAKTKFENEALISRALLISFLVGIIEMRLFTFLILVSLFATVICSSSPYTCTDLYCGHLFISPNRRHSSQHNIQHRDVFVLCFDSTAMSSIQEIRLVSDRTLLLKCVMVVMNQMMLDVSVLRIAS